MINWLVNKLFWWTPLREAIFAEVHMYDSISELMSDPESMKTGSSSYTDIDGWRAYSKSLISNVYYFNDIPEESLMKAFEQLQLMEIRSFQKEFDTD